MNKTEIYIGRAGVEYEVTFVESVPVYGQGCYSTKYLYKYDNGSWPFYLWYIKDDLDLNGGPDQKKEYDDNFEIKWNIIPMDIAKLIQKDEKPKTDMNDTNDCGDANEY